MEADVRDPVPLKAKWSSRTPLSGSMLIDERVFGSCPLCRLGGSVDELSVPGEPKVHQGLRAKARRRDARAGEPDVHVRWFGARALLFWEMAWK